MTATCPEIEPQLPEFALGLLDGDDRARVLDHTRSCPTCDARAKGLIGAVDDVTAALADTDPPPGFEGRVLERLDPPTSQPVGTRRSRVPMLAAAAVLLVLVAVVGTLVVTRSSTSSPEAVRQATMRTPSGATVGRATISGDPAAVLLASPNWSTAAAGPYRLRIVTTSGAIHQAGPVELDEGYAGYGLDGVHPDDVQRIEMITPDGTLACSADFS